MAFVPLEQEQTGFVPLDSVEQNPSLKDRIYKKANALFREGSAIDDFAGQPAASESDLASALSILHDAELSADARRQGGVSNSDVRIVDGLTGVLEMGARQGYAGIGRTEAGLIKALGDVLGSNTLSNVADDQMSYADKIERGAQLRDNKVEGFSPDSIAQDVPKAAASAIGSTIQTAPNLALAAVAPELVLPSIFATSTSQEYGEGRRDGLTGAGAAIRAPIMGAFEVAGEKLGGMDKLAAGLAKAARGHGAAELGSAMVASSAKELPGELFTTSGQFLTDKLPGVGTKQDAGLDEYAKQMKDTALTTLLQSAGMSAGGHVLSKVAGQHPAEQHGDTVPEQGVDYDKVIESLQRAEQVATSSREQGFQPLQEESPAAESSPKEVTPMAQPQEAATTPPPGQVAPPIQQDQSAPVVKESLTPQPETSTAQAENVKQDAAPAEQTAEPAASNEDSVRPHLEQLIKLRRVAGELGMPRQMDSLISKAKDGLKTGKIDRATFAKAAKLFKDKDARIYGALQGIAQASTPNSEAVVAAKKPARASGDLLQRIKQLGGIDGTQALDITGEKRAPGGWRFAFRNGGTGLDDLATQLAAEGFSINTNDVDGGVQQLRDMIRAHINGERSFKHADIEAQAEKQSRSAAYDAMAARAEELGINWKNLTELQLDDAVYQAEDSIKQEEIAAREALSEEGAAAVSDIADMADDGMDIPFGAEVQTDEAALAAFLGEEHGKDDKGAGENTSEGAGERAQAGVERIARTGSESQAEESGAGFLESYTETELSQKEAARKKEAEAAARRDAAPSPEEFTLTGSDRQADIGAAHGQTDLLEREQSAIKDLGEKIGMARKDTALSRGGRVTKESTDTAENDATWRKRFEAVQMNEQVDQPWHILDKKVHRFVRGDSMRNLEFSSKEAAEKMIPLAAVALKHRVTLTSRGDETPVYEIKRDVTDRKRITVVPEKFASREDAMKYMAEHAVEIIETKTSFGEEILPKPETVNRIGAVRRSGNVVGKDFMDTFGFRGVEFGNWNNQEERQDVLNHAYDGLLDLAEVLNIPPKAISLNGDLALAFGARGQGLSGARAHYERNRAVINLTKMSGAGALAHEWLHSLDHYLGRLDGKAKGEMVAGDDGTKTFGETSITDYASHGFSYNTKMRAELQAAYKELIETMFYKAEKYVEDTQKAEDWLGRARDSLRSELKKTRDYLARQLDPTYWKRNNKPASTEQLAKFDELADRLIEGKDLAVRPYFDEKKRVAGRLNNAMRMSNETLESLNAIIKDVRGRNGFNAAREGLLDGMRHPMSNYQQRITMLEEARNAAEKTKRIPTDYRKDATEIDQGRASDYWSTEHEMAARAFSSYVEDRLAEKGNSSDFLSYGSKGRIPTAFGWVRPFPAGEERVAINKAFDKFFDVVQTKETDKGTAMFSQSSKKNAAPQTVDEITKATARLRNGWSGFRKVSIVQSVKGIPNDVYLRALRALQPINQATEGIYDPNTNTVYLIADNIASPERAVWVAAHEVVGHGGIRMLNKSVAEHVDRLSKNGTIEKLAQAIAKDRGDTFDKSIHVQEAIAELAAAHITGDAKAIFDRYGVKVPTAMQSGILGAIARIVEAVRTFMAKVLNKPVTEVSDSEVRSLILQMKDAADGVEQSDSIGSGRAVMASMSQGTRDNQGQMPAFPDTAKGKALEFLWKLTANDWMFRMPTSFKKDMAGIANDMGLGKFTVRELPTDTVPEDAARKWQIKFTVDGIEKTAYITEDHDKQIFIDVSKLKQSQRGSEIYQIAAAYAHNTGRVFVPDPSGVSTIAVSRRIENLLSSALRYGTTKHLLPSDASGLNWIEGDDLHNIEQMLDATIRHTSENVDLIDHVEYDFHTNKFILIGDENETRSNPDKVEFTSRDFERAAERSFAGRDAGGTGLEGVGNTTLQRAVFAKSVLRQASSGLGRQLLAEAYSRIQQRETPVSALKGLYYSSAPEAYKAASKLPRNFDILAKVLPKHIPLVYDRDELGNIRSDFLGSRRLKDFLHASFLRPMAVRTGMAQANKELAKLMRSQKAAVDKAMRVASEVIDSTKGMTEEESSLISRIVTEEMQPGDVPPAHAMKIAAIVERAMTEQGQEAVELQMLSKEAYEKWKGKYLPRFYMRHLDPEVKGIWQRTFKASPISGFRSSSLKGRGKRQVVTVQELPEWEALGWEVADKAWKKNKQGQLELTVEGKAMPNTDTVAIWKDYTPDERRDMGEVQDFRLRFVMGYLSMQRDIAIGRLYRQIAANPDWTRRTPSEGYSYIPITEIPDTGGLNRYGMLAGLYVKDEILSHISQHENSDNEFQRYYKAALSKWKEGKTVLNPVTHMNNFVSNVTMAHFAGVSYWDGEKYFFALKDLIQNAPMMREAEDAGLFTGDFSHAEIMKAMPEEVRNLVSRETDSAAVKTGRFIWKLASLGLNEKMANAYHWGDVIFKYAIYRDARSKGMSPEDAVYHAAKFIFNYDDLPKTARAIRDYGLPFFAYTYKVIPALASTAIEYPWRFAAPAVIISSINAISYAALAGDSGDDDWWLRAIMSNTMTPLLNAYSMGFYGDDEPKTAGQKLEQEERKNLAEWDKGASAMGTQKTIRLGTDEKTGLPVFINVYRFIPGGDIQDTQNEKGGIGIPAPFMPSHPVLNAFSALVDNKNWDGKEMFDANDTGSEKAVKTADYLYKLAFPTIAPGGTHYDRLMNAAANFADTTIEGAHPLKDYTGTGKDGLPVQPKYAAMQTIGIKARPVDLEQSGSMNMIGDNAKVRSIDQEISRAGRLLSKGAISQREFDSIREKGIAKMRSLGGEAAEE